MENQKITKTALENWKIAKSELESKQEEYLMVAEWCNTNQTHHIEEINDEYCVVKNPEKSVEELQANVRAKRNALLDATDKYVSVPDFPIDEDTRNQYIEYRQYLRDYTKAENWWLTNPLTFEEWVINK